MEATPLAMYNYFIERVKSNLHIVLAMSPIGDAFRNRLRMFPSLINCCTIDWFQVTYLYHYFLISSHLGFVHPLQDVALHQCLPSSSVCCLPNPGGSLLLCYVILPSSAWSSSRPLPSPWLPLCASPCPPIVL